MLKPNAYICRYLIPIKNRDSSVGIALGCRLDDRGPAVRFPAGARNFSHHRIQNGSGAHPASYSMGTGGSFSEADHWPPSSAEVTNAWSFTSTPPICLHGLVLSQAQGQLYLLLNSYYKYFSNVTTMSSWAALRHITRQYLSHTPILFYSPSHESQVWISCNQLNRTQNI
jgi:hypothetical protein